MVSRVLVTGGAGFVGSHVVDALLARGIEVVILDLLLGAAHAEMPEYLHADAELIRGDLRDMATVERALRGVDAVSHQASMVGLGVDLRDLTGYASHNDFGTATLLEAMHRVRSMARLVLASSMVVYGEGGYSCPWHGRVRPGPRSRERLSRGLFEPPCPRCGRDLVPHPVDEEAALDPRNVYAATKVHQEHLCAAFAREIGTPVTALRYHNVYGPRMPSQTPYAGVASIFRSALAAGHAPHVFEDGGQIRDFVHVEDVARANVLALLNEPAVRGAFNVATGSTRTIGEVASTLSAQAGGGAPAPLVTGEFRLGDVRHVFASTALARNGLGFRARVTFEEGMRSFAKASLREPARALGRSGLRISFGPDSPQDLGAIRGRSGENVPPPVRLSWAPGDSNPEPAD